LPAAAALNFRELLRPRAWWQQAHAIIASECALSRQVAMKAGVLALVTTPEGFRFGIAFVKRVVESVYAHDAQL
jgi:hypothetical protein